MGSQYAILFAAVLLTGAQSAQADVYKYIDEDGNVVYSDEPPESAKAEKVQLEPYGPSSTPTPIGRVRRNDELGREIEQVDPERIEMLAREQIADHERRCNEARVALEVLHQGMPVYVVGSGKFRAAWARDTYDGQRVYLSDAQRKAAIDAQLRKLAMNCKDPLNEEEWKKSSTDWFNEEHCNAARVELADIQKPDSRASTQDIEIRRREVEKWCTQ